MRRYEADREIPTLDVVDLCSLFKRFMRQEAAGASAVYALAYPLCTGGAGACPPEDCGGIGGFCSLLEALQNPRHPQHRELLKWVGEDYDPEKFSIGAINRILHGRKKRAARPSD
jgi:pRiA4b ORF-3-like protein